MAKITIAKPEAQPMNTAAYIAPQESTPAVTETAAVVNETPAIPDTPPPAAEATPIAETAPAIVQNPANNEPTNVTKITFEGVEDEVPEVTTTVTNTQPAAKPKIEDILKDLPKEELYKYLGMDEHDIKFSEFRKNGGNPYDYIQQKAVDYNKIPDEVLLKNSLKEKYPNLEAEDIQVLYDDRYGQDELADDNANKRKSILAKADAYEVRQQKIKQQQTNEFPVTQQQARQGESEIEVAYKQQQANIDAYRNFVMNDEPVQRFLSEKKLKVDFGNGKFHTFDIQNPKHLVDSILDSKVAAKYGNNAQGQPDTQLMLEIALLRSHPQQYRSALLEQGRSLALLDELLKDGQNATPAVGRQPSSPASTNKKITPSGSRISTHG